MKPESKKLMIRLLVNSAVLIALYFAIPTLTHFSYMPLIYLLAGAGFGIYYVIYNRGFSGKGITLDQLPDTMTLAEKQKFIDDSRERMQKSRWVLTILLPIILTFLADMIYLFIFPYFESLFA